MEKCYEYFACKKEGCPAYGSKDRLECWEIEDTHCNKHNPLLEIMRKYQKDICKHCLYYTKVHSSVPEYWS
jgi:hypothetical protein